MAMAGRENGFKRSLRVEEGWVTVHPRFLTQRVRSEP